MRQAKHQMLIQKSDDDSLTTTTAALTWQTGVENLHEVGQVRISAALQQTTLDLKRAADFPVTQIRQRAPIDRHVFLQRFRAVGGFRGATFYVTGRDVLTVRGASDVDEFSSRARQRDDVEIAPITTGQI